jgi:hypothetical protein
MSTGTAAGLVSGRAARVGLPLAVSHHLPRHYPGLVTDVETGRPSCRPAWGHGGALARLAWLALLQADHELHPILPNLNVEHLVVEHPGRSGRDEHLGVAFADDLVLLGGLAGDLELQRCPLPSSVAGDSPEASIRRPDPSGISAFATMDSIAWPAFAVTTSIKSDPLGGKEHQAYASDHITRGRLRSPPKRRGPKAHQGAAAPI